MYALKVVKDMYFQRSLVLSSFFSFFFCFFCFLIAFMAYRSYIWWERVGVRPSYIFTYHQNLALNTISSLIFLDDEVQRHEHMNKEPMNYNTNNMKWLYINLTCYHKQANDPIIGLRNLSIPFIVRHCTWD